MYKPYNLGRVCLTHRWGHPASLLLKASAFPSAHKPPRGQLSCRSYHFSGGSLLPNWVGKREDSCYDHRVQAGYGTCPWQCKGNDVHPNSCRKSRWLQRVRAPWLNFCRKKRSAHVTWITVPLSGYKSHPGVTSLEQGSRGSACPPGRFSSSWHWHRLWLGSFSSAMRTKLSSRSHPSTFAPFSSNFILEHQNQGIKKR